MLAKGSHAEPDSVFYEEAVAIAEDVLGIKISKGAGAIDPSIFDLIDKIAEWLIKIIQALQERFGPDADRITTALRRRKWIYERRVEGRVVDETPVKYRRHARKIAVTMFQRASAVDSEVVARGLEELNDDMMLV